MAIRLSEKAERREAQFEHVLGSATIDIGKISPVLPFVLSNPYQESLDDWRGRAFHPTLGPVRGKSSSYPVIDQSTFLISLRQGYLPNIGKRQQISLERRRTEYRSIVEQHFGPRARRDAALIHQIAIDVPRTAPDMPLFRNALVREAIARILYCWSIRRPASGYVQGINDLVTPFIDVFLTDESRMAPVAASEEDANDAGGNIVLLTEEEFFRVEADAFWCLSKLLDGIQDNYTFSQSGITRQLARLRTILSRTNPILLQHLDAQGVQLMQVAFRWMNCLLMREFPLHMIIRMWDTYLAEEDGGFAHFHIYVCAALLGRWANHLLPLEFTEIMLFLQNPPTAAWSVADLEMLLAEAYVWKTLFHQTHL